MSLLTRLFLPGSDTFRTFFSKSFSTEVFMLDSLRAKFFFLTSLWRKSSDWVCLLRNLPLEKILYASFWDIGYLLLEASFDQSLYAGFLESLVLPSVIPSGWVCHWGALSSQRLSWWESLCQVPRQCTSSSRKPSLCQVLRYCISISRSSSRPKSLPWIPWSRVHPPDIPFHENLQPWFIIGVYCLSNVPHEETLHIELARVRNLFSGFVRERSSTSWHPFWPKFSGWDLPPRLRVLRHCTPSSRSYLLSLHAGFLESI